MVSTSLSAALLLVFSSVIAGCSASAPPPLPPSTPVPGAVLEPEGPPDAAVEPALVLGDAGGHVDPVPQVLRRIRAEEADLIARCRELARELRDPGGRARALSETGELATELARIAAPLDDADSDGLDDAARELQLLDTRITLLHEKLRAATERTTAVLID